ncbi:IclR-like transcriptional regulator [Burkholderiales bacterium JOSHI_001]|nr:IclR-like transcriptional regulator [Burkholderiales bacterium JOSHI_001]
MWTLSPDLLLKDTLDLWSSRALAAGQHLGVFAELGKGPRTAARLAATLGLAPGAASDLLDALVALGWLQREGDDADAVYVSTRTSAQYLDPRGSAYLGDLLQAARAPLQASDDSRLDDALRARAPARAPPVSPVWDAQCQLMRRRLGALHGQALATLPVAAMARRVLSLNDAGACLARAWAAQAGPRTRFTSLQGAEDAAATCAEVPTAAMAARVQVVSDDTPTEEHDLLVFNLVLAPGDSAWRRAGLRKALRWLGPGARVLLLDHLADDARRVQVPALVFGLAQRMTGQAQGTRTEGELRADCLAVGLQPDECLPLLGGASVLVTHQALA